MQNLGKPELEKVWQRRKPDADGKLGPIRGDRVAKSKSSCGGELEKQLARRTQLLDQVSDCTLRAYRRYEKRACN